MLKPPLIENIPPIGHGTSVYLLNLEIPQLNYLIIFLICVQVASFNEIG